MNYLAHLYLSVPTPEAWLGSLLGDFVKGPLHGDFAPAINDAIRIHRKIDQYTDTHPRVLSAKTLFTPESRRYAGILLDMYFDHCLARHWHQFAPGLSLPALPQEAASNSLPTLAEFSTRVYRALALQLDHPALPQRFRQMLPHLIRQDWLGSYADLGQLRLALDNMARRLRNPDGLRHGAGELVRLHSQLEPEFFHFFPELVAYTNSLGPAVATTFESGD